MTEPRNHLPPLFVMADKYNIGAAVFERIADPETGKEVLQPWSSVFTDEVLTRRPGKARQISRMKETCKRRTEDPPGWQVCCTAHVMNPDGLAALAGKYHSDAHAVSYHWPSDGPHQVRLTKKCLESLIKAASGTAPLLCWLFIDVDDERLKGWKNDLAKAVKVANACDVHASADQQRVLDVLKSGEPAVRDAHAEWRAAQYARLAEHPFCTTAGFYETGGGYRLVWPLAEPVELRPAIVPDTEGRIRAVIQHLRAHGIDADEACTDWTRLMRLPRVIRDGKRQDRRCDFSRMQPMDLTTFDPVYPPGKSPAEIEARNRSRRSAPARSTRKPTARHKPQSRTTPSIPLPNPPCRQPGEQTDWSSIDLIAFFQHLGLYGHESMMDVHIVECPWDHEHTTGDPGDGSTVIFTDATPGFFCHHAHCSGRGNRDLRLHQQDLFDACCAAALAPAEGACLSTSASLAVTAAPAEIPDSTRELINRLSPTVRQQITASRPGWSR